MTIAGAQIRDGLSGGFLAWGVDPKCRIRGIFSTFL
eukprot:COSAG02_NODE_31166_length_538_cov_0.993166_2_plen_35_part_01